MSYNELARAELRMANRSRKSVINAIPNPVDENNPPQSQFEVKQSEQIIMSAKKPTIAEIPQFSLPTPVTRSALPTPSTSPLGTAIATPATSNVISSNNVMRAPSSTVPSSTKPHVTTPMPGTRADSARRSAYDIYDKKQPIPALSTVRGVLSFDDPSESVAVSSTREAINQERDKRNQELEVLARRNVAASEEALRSAREEERLNRFTARRKSSAVSTAAFEVVASPAPIMKPTTVERPIQSLSTPKAVSAVPEFSEPSSTNSKLRRMTDASEQSAAKEVRAENREILSVTIVTNTSPLHENSTLRRKERTPPPAPPPIARPPTPPRPPVSTPSSPSN